MNKSKRLYIFLVTSLLLVSILIVGGEIFAFSRLSMIQSSFSEIKYRNEKITDKIEILRTLEKRYEKIEPDLEKINTALPDQKESSGLLSDLDSLAQSSGLKLTLLQATELEKKSKGSSDKSLLQTIKGKYGQELPLVIRVEGPFSSFVTFMKRIEDYQRLVAIDGVEINRSEDPTASTDNIEVKLNLRAYLKK